MTDQKQKSGKPTLPGTEGVAASKDAELKAKRERLSGIASAAFTGTKSGDSTQYLNANRQSGGQ